ncbi:MAG: phosphatase [Eubacteriales bacterium]|jgi:putative hydrolase|nr:phosphatase [Eubacteriales bacterium]
MRILADLHCHTTASAHAYSTIKEYADMAAEYSMEAFAVTNHGPKSADGAHIYHFGNLVVVPRVINGVTVLKGAECNILDSDGTIDLPPNILEKLDVIIASIHQAEYAPKSEKEHTKVLLNVMDNPNVHIMGHMGREKMPFDIEKVVKKAKETKKLIEINSSSIKKEGRILERCREIALACKKHEVPIVVNSDCHICYDIGNVGNAIELLDSINFDKNLIMNTSLEKALEFLNIRL